MNIKSKTINKVILSGIACVKMHVVGRSRHIAGAALLCALCAPSMLHAQDGSSAYNYLNVTSSTRIYGLGGVNITAVEDELSVADQNPALLGWEMDNRCMVGWIALFRLW
jgi:hypothetical protein